MWSGGGKIPHTFKGNGFFTWFPFHVIRRTLISSRVLAKICTKKKRCRCELIFFVGSRIVVGEPSVLFPLLEFCGKSRYFSHISVWERAFSLLKMRTYNSPCTQHVEQALYWTLPSDCLYLLTLSSWKR